MSESSIYKVVSKGAYRNITAKLNPELKGLITPDLKLTGPISIGGNYQRIELNYSVENDIPILRFKISKEANETSAIEVLIRIAEDLLTNLKMRVQ
jgi:hypothetical protein